MSISRTSGVLLTLLLLCPSSAAAEGGVPGALSQFNNSKAYNDDLPFLVNTATGDGAGKGIQVFGKLTGDHGSGLQKAAGEVLGKLTAPPGSGTLTGKAREGLNTLHKNTTAASRLNKFCSKWAGRVGRALNYINITTVVVRGVGRGLEGDYVGIVEVVADEGAKRGAATLGGTLGTGSGGPGVGTVVGAIAGEELYTRFGRPVLENAADSARTALARKRMHGSAIADPKERKRRQTIEEDRLEQELGVVGPEEMEVEGFKTPGMVLRARVKATMTPTHITARGKMSRDFSSGEFKNIVTTTHTLRFYNVGGAVPGYGKAIFSSTAVASLNGATSRYTCQGLFSGGPNGTFRLACKRSRLTFKLHKGSTAKARGVTLKVKNPGAFAGWPGK